MEVTGDVGLYGWRVRSGDVPLPGRPLDRGGVPDIEVQLERGRHVPSTPAPGAVVAELVGDGRRWYSVSERESGWLLRFHGASDIEVSIDGRVVRCRPDPSVGPGVVQILVAGTVLAFVHAVGGRSVLHASAVEVEGRAVAVLGPSGAGKSTIAAALCAGGAKLVTDDVLVADAEAGTCLAGATSLRLRAGAHRAVELFGTRPPEYTTADGRLAIAPPATDRSELPLAAVIVPYPVAPSAGLSLTRLSWSDAALAIAGAPRIPGWRGYAPRRRFFGQAVGLASRVPVFAAEIPWGLAGTAALLDRFLEASADGASQAPATVSTG